MDDLSETVNYNVYSERTTLTSFTSIVCRPQLTHHQRIGFVVKWSARARQPTIDKWILISYAYPNILMNENNKNNGRPFFIDGSDDSGFWTLVWLTFDHISIFRSSERERSSVFFLLPLIRISLSFSKHLAYASRKKIKKKRMD